MRKFSSDELQEILRKHSHWLAGDDDGERADLRGADLSDADLSYANLSNAILSGADLSDADMHNANLSGANMLGANMYAANLSDANMHCTYLFKANLSSANLNNASMCSAYLRHTNLRGASLYNADLHGADLSGADLSDANMRGAKNVDSVIWNMYTVFYPIQCPESGSFIGYKTASDLIVKLEICEDALRSSATSRKCRCSKARVLGFENLDGTPVNNVTRVSSNYNYNFIYEIGKTVEVPDFDTNRWNECAPGIHFFITREEAVKYAN